MNSIRVNYAEGKFYPDNKDEIISMFENAVNKERGEMHVELATHPIIGGVVPHAGYRYCVAEAVHFFEILRQSKQHFDVVIIINPNHTGQGEVLSIDDHNYWSTPLGKAKIDRELALATTIPLDTLSQQREHSGEVILPYIQYFLGLEMPILPISFGAQSAHNANVVGQILYETCKQLRRKPLIIASSDFNHFDTPQIGKEKDAYALEALLRKDYMSFEQRLREKDISICGYGCILALLAYAVHVDKDYKISVLKRGNSGSVLPSSEVVDYVSMLVYR